mmetsp:Transcript_27286/g.66378  ORF Transcript_27286/g.66378 Transcript_27286/m.66378 type:complete len:87 (+) Transcript_27286:687-947(+)
MSWSGDVDGLELHSVGKKKLGKESQRITMQFPRSRKVLGFVFGQMDFFLAGRKGKTQDKFFLLQCARSTQADAHFCNFTRIKAGTL